FGAPPPRETDQPCTGELVLLEVDLGLAHEALGTALALHELHPHRSPPRDSMSRMRHSGWPGRFGLAVSGIAPKTTSFDPPLRKKSGGRRRNSTTTAEGQPHVRGDVGGGGVSRRASRSEAEGTPKGLARPRNAGGPGGARGRLRSGTSGPRRSVWPQ